MTKRLIPIFILILTVIFGYGNLKAADDLIVPCDPEIFPMDSTSIQTLDCAVDAKFCIPIPLADQTDYQYLVNGTVYAGTLLGCDFDTVVVSYTYDNWDMTIPGPYTIDSWMVNSVNFTGSFNDITELVAFMNSNDPTGNWVDTPGPSIIIGGDSNNTYSDINVMLSNGTVVVLGASYGVESLGTLIDLPIGEHELIAIDQVNICQDTIIVTVDCITPENIVENILVGEMDTMCIDFSQLSDGPFTVTSFCPAAADGDVSFSLIASDSCVAYVGNTVGQDSLCLEACDAMGLCDTTILFVQVAAPPTGNSTHVFDTLMIGEIDVHCLDNSMIGAGPFEQYDDCVGSSGTSVDFRIDTMSYCVIFEALGVIGTDTLCQVVCGDLTCDTTYIYVTVEQDPNVQSNEFVNIFINGESSYCPDTFALSGNIDSIYNICPTISGGFVMFEPDLTNYCMNFEAIATGCDTACIVLRDDLGDTITTSLIVCVLEPTTEVIYDTIMLGMSNNYCIDTLELAGTIQTIQDYCDTLLRNSVDFQNFDINLCFDGVSTAVGTDTACIEICDDFNVCDTTIYIVTVQDPSMSLPVASNDVDTMSLNQLSLGINVCANDVIPGGVLNDPPINLPIGGIGSNGGTFIGNLDCTVSYVPAAGFCGDVDSISYSICNSAGCDSATIVVYVECSSGTGEFEIHNAFSPNGDAVNDYFIIDGIENLDNHLLCIYNRWGNQVLRTDNYQNDWEGTFDGADLPSGTYFYVFDDGNGVTHSGHIQIMR